MYVFVTIDRMEIELSRRRHWRDHCNEEGSNFQIEDNQSQNAQSQLLKISPSSTLTSKPHNLPSAVKFKGVIEGNGEHYMHMGYCLQLTLLQFVRD